MMETSDESETKHSIDLMFEECIGTADFLPEPQVRLNPESCTESFYIENHHIKQKYTYETIPDPYVHDCEQSTWLEDLTQKQVIFDFESRPF